MNTQVESCTATNHCTPAPAASSHAVPMSTTRVAQEDELIDLWYHYWNALKCCIFTISPVCISLVVLLYVFASTSGWEFESDYARCGVIIGIVYASTLLFYFIVLLPLIIFTRTVDSALFSNSGSILTSSMVEISILTLFVVVSLLLTYYNTTHQ